MLNNLKNVGLVAFDPQAQYQREIIEVLSQKGKEEGYNLLIFSGFSCYGENSSNYRGEANIVNLIPFDKLDGLIICPDTFPEEAQDNVFYHARKNATCPVVVLRQQSEDFYSIVIDDTKAISDAVKHFRVAHKFKRIAYMSGPYNRKDSMARLNQYKKTMDMLGLTYSDNYIFEGDYWIGRSKEAAKHFASLPELPEAIVCANDYMALSLTNELNKLDINVPDDIAISGLDGIEETETTIPSITTAKVNNIALINKAIEIILNDWNNIEQPRVHKFKTELIVRESCGCKEISIKNISKKYSKLRTKFNELKNDSLYNMFATLSLESLENIESLNNFISPEVNLPGINDIFILLGNDESDHFPKTHIKYPGFAKDSKSIYSLLNKELITTSPIKTSELLPKEAIRPDSMTVYFLPIHYFDTNLGYVAFTKDNNLVSSEILYQWTATLGMVIENLA